MPSLHATCKKGSTKVIQSSWIARVDGQILGGVVEDKGKGRRCGDKSSANGPHLCSSMWLL